MGTALPVGYAARVCGVTYRVGDTSHPVRHMCGCMGTALPVRSCTLVVYGVWCVVCGVWCMYTPLPVSCTLVVSCIVYRVSYREGCVQRPSVPLAPHWHRSEPRRREGLRRRSTPARTLRGGGGLGAEAAADIRSQVGIHPCGNQHPTIIVMQDIGQHSSSYKR